MTKKTKDVEVIPMLRYWICDKDGCEGHMHVDPDQKPTLTSPTRHVHRCDECGRKGISSVVYPYVHYRQKEILDSFF